ncbi:ImmA/IrrE family metallo-endopeptidase [Amycolatopsis sp. 195334CR]|uniref:ImmA/IrrE family metallo-endopeptidase n=1 Tax=Amycolatopsis sp. 195334CR TaxID=2814588 RepID=UPI001A903C75|nr:ImmA/IrrE family metallo-endopeptidase [Amycolatopsis sp. 195334CR]MBN6040067.1 ImmA/IrrE family metallo-endopeptidase [Amycolatopsis sp. 195334CR]
MAAVHALNDAGLPGDRRTDLGVLIRHARLKALADSEGERLFGIYFPPGADRPGGIWINAAMSPVTQRHTVAHELGHHAFAHGLSCDTTIASLSGSLATSTLTESLAEAFAAWALMPRAALVRALATLSVVPEHVRPEDVYRVALLLGTTYKGTARQLGVARIIGTGQAAALSRAVPGKIKRTLDDPAAPPRRAETDVWRIDLMAAARELTLHHGDRILLPATADQAAETLLAGDAADFVHQSDNAITLTARASLDRNDIPRRHAVSLPRSDEIISIGVESGPVRAAATEVPRDVTNAGHDDLDRILAEQQANRNALR